MKKCPLCGEFKSSNENFCQYDGGELVDIGIRCPRCDEKVWVDDKFCKFCGKNLLDKSGLVTEISLKEMTKEEIQDHDNWIKEAEATGN
jgi:hypothetical protein